MHIARADHVHAFFISFHSFKATCLTTEHTWCKHGETLRTVGWQVPLAVMTTDSELCKAHVLEGRSFIHMGSSDIV